MFAAPGLAVSLPARELAEDPPPGSLFGTEHLAEARISSDLRVAVGLIDTACRRRNLPLVFVARPEIFTHSASLAWLQGKLGGVENHLCISDGMAIRVVPSMRNHMFLYRQGIQANTDAFGRLMRRAPELISTLRAQVNTAYGVRLGQQRLAPPTVVIAGESGQPAQAAELYRFYLNRHTAPQSALLSIAAGPLGPDHIAAFTRIVYVPLTEVAARDRAFAQVLGPLLLAAYFDPATCVLLRLPQLAAPLVPVSERIAVALAGLCVAPCTIPRVLADNILYVTEDPGADWLHGAGATVDLVAHESFDFWRHPIDFYGRCRAITIHASARRRGDRGGVRAALAGLLGRAPDLRWLPRDDPNDP